MNQKCRQKATNSGEGEFFKYPNNSNYGYDSRNNQGNCTFEPLLDEVNEMSYLKMYNDNLDKWVSSFVNCELTEHKIASEFKGKMLMVKFNNFNNITLILIK